jgi:hypothetical protein
VDAVPSVTTKTRLRRALGRTSEPTSITLKIQLEPHTVAELAAIAEAGICGTTVERLCAQIVRKELAERRTRRAAAAAAERERSEASA